MKIEGGGIAEGWQIDYSLKRYKYPGVFVELSPVGLEILTELKIAFPTLEIAMEHLEITHFSFEFVTCCLIFLLKRVTVNFQWR